MIRGATAYCKNCGSVSFLCDCKVPEIICATCGKPLGFCKCDPSQLLHQCEFCLEFKVTEYNAITGVYVCMDCLQKPVVKYRLGRM
jgi:hypothetical protein